MECINCNRESRNNKKLSQIEVTLNEQGVITCEGNISRCNHCGTDHVKKIR